MNPTPDTDIPILGNWRPGFCKSYLSTEKEEEEEEEEEGDVDYLFLYANK